MRKKTTSRETWKSMERKIAKLFEAQRNPLSGKHSKHTSADVIHGRFYIECKYRKKWAIVRLYNEVKDLAKKEEKIPILVIKEKNKHGELVILSVKDFLKLINEK